MPTSPPNKKLIQLLKRYKEAFAWDYPDMKGIDPQLCTHHIYIEKDARPIHQPQRRLNPHLKDVVKAEIQKLLDVNFIYPISDSKWVSPFVVVPKKNGNWRICVDYRELNKATQKDHFPLPFIDQVLDTLAGKKFFSFLDGFSRYNQIHIAPEDQDKTTFTCPWGTFSYRVLPFGLCNAPATFQRAILNIFANLINQGLEVYMDDFTPYGDDFDLALDTLEKVLQCCIATRLCLSHEKCYMMMIEGLILGHYISAAGIQVDPAKIQIILLIPTPTTQTEVRSFLGFSGYYRRFIEHFSHIATPLYALTGNVDFLWIEKCERAFQDLKKLVSTAPVLRGPNWDLPFQISSDALDTAIGAILGHYITGYHVILYTDHSNIKYLANKPITNGKITRWLILLQEFDITIKDRPGKENHVADFLSRMPKPMDAAAVEDQFPDENLFVVAVKTPWYADVANYLVVGKLPKHLTPNERNQIVQRSARFSWIGGYLFHTGADMHIKRCVCEDEIFDILKACHDGPYGGHFTDRKTGHKVLQIGYYWPTIFKDAKKFVQACDSCQRARRPEALPRATKDFVIQFLFHIFVQYGLPRDIITDGGPQFAGNKIAATLKNYHIQHKITTPYHPQANGQVESSNKIVEAILTKTIASHRRNSAVRLLEALWAYRTTWRSTTDYSPYQLVFGKQPIFPIEFKIQTLRTTQEVGLDLSEAQINRLQQINELDEIRLDVLQNTALIQQQRAKWHDALIKNKVFHEGDWALLYDSRFQDFPGKL
eukprot:PITA_05544